MKKSLTLLAVVSALVAGALPLHAGMSEILDAIKESEFSFMRSVSEVPFVPVVWVQDRYYPEARFEDEQGVLPSADAVENTIDSGLIVPTYVAKRDMMLAGGDLSWDKIDVRSGPYQDQSVLRLTAVAAWLHQYGELETLGAFVAPIFSKELENDEPWGVNGYAGIIGIHHYSSEFELFYGGVYQYDFGRHILYPYLGVRWLPTPKVALDIIFPWPALSYAPHKRWLLQLKLEPGGSSWVKRDSGYEATTTFGSWNVVAGAAYQLKGHFWLYGGAGLAGLRGVKIESGGNETRFESKPGSVFTLALQFRP